MQQLFLPLENINVISPIDNTFIPPPPLLPPELNAQKYWIIAYNNNNLKWKLFKSDEIIQAMCHNDYFFKPIKIFKCIPTDTNDFENANKQLVTCMKKHAFVKNLTYCSIAILFTWLIWLTIVL